MQTAHSQLHFIIVLDLLVALTLRIQRIRQRRAGKRRQAQPHRQQPSLVHLDHPRSFLTDCAAGAAQLPGDRRATAPQNKIKPGARPGRRYLP